MPTALITGASSGLGSDFARILGGMRYELILVARDLDRMKVHADALSRDYGVQCHVIRFDLSQADSAQGLFDTLESKKLQIDVLINNAGSGLWGAFSSSDLDSLRRMLQLNMNTLAELTRLFLPGMIARGGGRILNVASTAAFQPGPLMAAYYASKSFVLHLGEAVAEEVHGTGVTVTTLCPGPTKTEFFERANMGNSRLKQMVMADSMTCARRGIDAMFQGRILAVDGWMNWILTLSPRLLPRAIIRIVTGKLNASAK